MTQPEPDGNDALRIDHPDVIAFPPLIFAACLVLAVVLTWMLPGYLPPSPELVIFIPGAVVVALAGWLALSGIFAFRRAGTNIEPFKPSLVVVQDGPYRFTRNPMYSGMVLMMVGLGLLFSVDYALPVAILLWLILHNGVVLREESYLSRKFGESYQTYLTQTRRWI